MIESNLLYIIGNGFDLHHNLPTSYGYFEKFMENWSKLMYHEIHRFWEFKITNDKWSDFENDLSTYNSKKMYEEFSQTDRGCQYIAEKCSSETQKLYEGITNCFIDWVKDIKLEPITKKVKLTQNAEYITFNYTKTLQYIYEIPESAIWHIHGASTDSDLIFGHEKKEKIEYNYSDGTGMPSTEQEWCEEALRFAKLPLNQFRKKTDKIIKENSDRFTRYQNIEKIYVLGHSLADVDLPYFEVIHKSNKKAKWCISYYNILEQENLCSKLKGIGVKKSQMVMITMNNLNKDK
ncbi:bacteriophage abortive infection AbiH family protein [Tenacibaculum sp. AHE15PA]|uniref:bacteriophage abortive infection AbiH family protein n=1 Tax=unclassified Tenacibaculum TaxID=2635139 RepID=UPI001C5003B8|nr:MULTISPECIES: bacteriophage abortive infection AbiH family protein [unclassified Tenacibaculum]QXP74677.1 bacteriophage abortive infection AbiH family protein [Tenacibaculum sp. AHE14PA]QXP76188.1 bacteriophage abortive infection AbiH family protein [Tenacibaculum sp. AHE15PA]